MNFTAEEFPTLATGRIHLNHAGISPIPTCARIAMERYAREAAEDMGTGNPKWYAEHERARAVMARLINAQPQEIAFTHNTTHGLLIVANSVNWKPGDVVVVEENTFPANWYGWKTLEDRCGVRVVPWPERERRYLREDLARILKEHPVRLVSASAVDYGTGFRHDINAVGAMAKDAGALFCVDAIQWIGAFAFDVEACRADFVSADSHKWMLGPEGAAIFFCREAMLDQLNESMVGWIGRENFQRYDARDLKPHPSARRFEEGAHNHAGIFALGAVGDLLLEVGLDTITKGVLANRAILVEGMRDLGWSLQSPDEDRMRSGIVMFSHPDIADPMALSKALLAEGIVCVSRRGWLRFAPHFYQPAQDMRRAVETVGRLMKSVK